MAPGPKKPGTDPNHNRAISRRNFLTFGVGAISGLIAVALGIPLVVAAISPALKKNAAEWIEVASVDAIRIGEPQKAEYTMLKKDGWVEEAVRKAVWIAAKDSQNMAVFDPRCTHLGCAYSWQPDKKRFFCPCHDGVFDIDGRVIGGPPPRPLDRYETKIEGGKLFIGQMYSVDANFMRTS